MEAKGENNKIIVIGAGLAGLTTAQEILKGNPNAQVTVLEAMPEPGGRTRSIEVNGATFDLGAQWIGYPQKFVKDLAQRAQLQVRDQYHQGRKILQLGTDTSSYTSNIPQGVGIFQLIHMQLLMWKLDKMAKSVPLDNPGNCPNAFLWDSMTYHTWIEQNVWFDKIKRLLQLAVRSVVGCQSNEISFLFFLWYIHHNHGIDCVVNIQNGLQDKKFLKGTQALSKFLEKQILSRGGKIHYNSFVNQIIQNQNGVIIKTRKGQQYKGDYIVIAAPPHSLKNIAFEPQLSRQRRFIRDHYIMGQYTKMIILYPKHYWRDTGFSGEILSDCYGDPVLMSYDDTRYKQNGQAQPAIVVFFAASIDSQWTRDRENCQKIVLQKLASHFKEPLMLNPLSVQMKVWNEEESIGGAPCAYTPPGVLTKMNDIRESEGRIHWAGTQTANISQGYMDGAIESGIRVSKEILARVEGQKFDIKPKPVTSRWYTQIMSFRRPNFWNKFVFW